MTKENIITLCGPIRFEDWFRVVAAELTLKGWIVLGPEVWGLHSLLHDEKNLAWTTEKQGLDALHYEKIRISKAIFVIDPLGYVGNSTMREIAFAKAHDKVIMYWSNGDLNKA